jgi:carbon monoxide dehydrogenase subunit G
MVWTGCASQALAPPVAASAPAAAALQTADEVASDPPSEDLIQVAEEVVINAPIERVWAVFDDPEAYRHILPLVRSIEPRGKDARGALRLGITQGVAFASGSYTALIFKVRPHEIELRIDHAFPSILREGRGSVELKSEGANRTRVVYRMTADLGDGWFLPLFKERIRRALTRPPYLLKRYVEAPR